MSHRTQPIVLLVEANPSLRRLIALGLQYRDMHVIEAHLPAHLLTAEVEQPELLIIDVDGKVHGDWSLLTTVQAHPYLSSLPVILLTWQCPVPAGAASGNIAHLQSQVTCLSKPFDVRALHTTIEQLLAARAQQEALQAQVVRRVTQVSAPSPSIWPLITAVGLLLAFIGLMGLLVISVLGLCIVVVSLLWWTLGTGSKKVRAPLPLGLSNG